MPTEGVALQAGGQLLLRRSGPRRFGWGPKGSCQANPSWDLTAPGKVVGTGAGWPVRAAPRPPTAPPELPEQTASSTHPAEEGWGHSPHPGQLKTPSLHDQWEERRAQGVPAVPGKWVHSRLLCSGPPGLCVHHMAAGWGHPCPWPRCTAPRSISNHPPHADRVSRGSGVHWLLQAGCPGPGSPLATRPGTGCSWEGPSSPTRFCQLPRLPPPWGCAGWPCGRRFTDWNPGHGRSEEGGLFWLGFQRVSHSRWLGRSGPS